MSASKPDEPTNAVAPRRLTCSQIDLVRKQERDRHTIQVLCDMAERDLGTWRPIASAPKDGTPILLGYFLEGGGGGNPVVARWHGIHHKWCTPRDLLNADGYFSPTHWMPLPPPPGALSALPPPTEQQQTDDSHSD